MRGVEPVEALRRIAYLLERTHEPTYRVRAFRNAADIVGGSAPASWPTAAETAGCSASRGREATAKVINEALRGETPSTCGT